MKNFQVIILIVFAAAAIFGIFVFSGRINIGRDQAQVIRGNLILWGTLRTAAVLPALEEFGFANPEVILKYEEKSTETFDRDLLEALAAGRGPDLFLLPDNLAFGYKNKIIAVPYGSVSPAVFKRTFAGAGEVFLTSRGILALPILIDPLVMYYNRSMLDSNGIVEPPATWEEALEVSPKLTKKDALNNLSKSAVALGHFANVTHAKDILSALFMQAGNPIVHEKSGVFVSNLSEGASRYNLGSALRFYTSFSDPLSGNYAWNRSFPNSRDAFSSERLALYFGFASELRAMVERNPNQDFLVAPFPQNREASFKVTSARVMGLAISAGSRNLSSALAAANFLANGAFPEKLAATLGMVPARRDLIARPPEDSFSPAFYASALYARSWLDPSPPETNDVFRTMVERVLANTFTPEAAISDADAKLNLLLSR